MEKQKFSSNNFHHCRDILQGKMSNINPSKFNKQLFSEKKFDAIKRRKEYIIDEYLLDLLLKDSSRPKDKDILDLIPYFNILKKKIKSIQVLVGDIPNSYRDSF